MKSISILIVDDDLADIELARRILERAGEVVEIETAMRLEQAQKLLSDQPFDLVIVDLGLPDGTGIDNVKTLKSVAPNVPIIVLSGWDGAFSNKLIKAGAVAFVEKNEMASQLVNAIELAVSSNHVVENRVSKTETERADSGKFATSELLKASSELGFLLADFLVDHPDLRKSKSMEKVVSASKRIQEISLGFFAEKQ